MLYSDVACTKILKRKILHLKLGSQRGHWKYIPSQAVVELDNGNVYNQGAIHELVQSKVDFRKQMLPKKAKVEESSDVE